MYLLIPIQNMLISEENPERNAKSSGGSSCLKLYLHKYFPWINRLKQVATLDGLNKINLLLTDKGFFKTLRISALIPIPLGPLKGTNIVHKFRYICQV